MYINMHVRIHEQIHIQIHVYVFVYMYHTHVYVYMYVYVPYTCTIQIFIYIRHYWDGRRLEWDGLWGGSRAWGQNHSMENVGKCQILASCIFWFGVRPYQALLE